MKLFSSPRILPVLISCLLLNSCAERRNAVQLQLNSAPWSFPSGSSLSALSSQQTSATFESPSDSSSFTIKMRVSLQQADLRTKNSVELLQIPGVLSVKMFVQDAKDRKHQNYPAYAMPDGSVPVLEAALKLHTATESKGERDMPIGIPLAILKKPEGVHEVALHFSGVRWTLYVDNELLDNDFPLG
ncbi:MAG: hypothetical protein EOO88_19820, partial [Pedobacter sp.]